jgi:hypothetical protein
VSTLKDNHGLCNTLCNLEINTINAAQHSKS